MGAAPKVIEKDHGHGKGADSVKRGEARLEINRVKSPTS